MTVHQTLLFELAIILACLYSFIVLLVVPLAHIAEKIRCRVVDKNYLGLERDEEIVIAAIRKLDDETIKRITGPAKKMETIFPLHCGHHHMLHHVFMRIFHLRNSPIINSCIRRYTVNKVKKIFDSNYTTYIKI